MKRPLRPVRGKTKEELSMVLHRYAIVNLSKIKMSVGFNVLHKIIESSKTCEKYSQFLKEAIEFTRKYICNKDVEIIIIEDNCPLHCSEIIEETIKKLCIALLPIVPYSLSLNGVVDGYFGIVKTHMVLGAILLSDNNIKDDIENQWDHSSMEYFDDEISLQLFRVWRMRMQKCKNGEPLYSEHI